MNGLGQSNSTSIFRMCPDVTIDMALPGFSPCDPSQGGSAEWMLGASQFGFRPTVESLQYSLDSGNLGGGNGSNAKATLAMAQGAITSGSSDFIPLGLSRNGSAPQAYTLFSTPLSQLPGGY